MWASLRLSVRTYGRRIGWIASRQAPRGSPALPPPSPANDEKTTKARKRATVKPPMLSALDDAHLVRTSAAYRGMMIGLVLSLVVTLLTILDFRRGFLFAAYPVRSVFYAFNPAHVPLLGMGLAGIFACYQGINHLEARVSGTSRHMKALTLTIFRCWSSTSWRTGQYRPRARSLPVTSVLIGSMPSASRPGGNRSHRPRAIC